MASTFQSLFKVLAESTGSHEEQHAQQEEQIPSSIVPGQYQGAGYCSDVSILSTSPIPIQQQASLLSSYGYLDNGKLQI